MIEYPYFSCSRINTFRKCPKAFEFSYVQELDEAFETIEKHLGSAVHELFEWLYLEKAAGRHGDEAAAEQRYEEIWNSYDIAAARIVKSGRSAQDYYQQGLDMALAYARRVIWTDKTRTLHLEHQFDLDLGEGIVYRGIIDRVARTETGCLRLIDYKTGRSVPEPQTDLQLRSYALAMLAVEADRFVEICYEDLRQERSLTMTIERSQCPAIEDELRRGIAEIRAAATFTASPSTLCSWCGHLPHCPEGERHLNAVADAEKRGICPRCGAVLKHRNGKFGPFWSCSTFPACRYSRNG